MTVEQALARARELRPGCKISDETCRRWLCEEDALLRQQLFGFSNVAFQLRQFIGLLLCLP